ncbi:unnamed protein product [Prorocentrum cordatum]|uniref:Uncharacterized protein n=1 Tax=Prorocentrum cordatum TaxID=2364126 RepID=A0ABN9RW93_9DINO|nr:unnamed protein product [Polarella glacialis]
MGMSSDELFKCYPWGPGHRLAADANVYEFSFTLEPIEILGDLLSPLGLDENEGFNLRSFGRIDSYSGEPATHQSAFVLTEYESSFTLDSLEFLDTNLPPSMGSARYEDFDTNDSWGPLYGGGGKGGSRTSQRVRTDKSQIQDQLIALATAVAELQRAQMGARTAPKAGRVEARPSKPTTTRPRRQRRQREGIPIVAKLRSLPSVADGGMNVTQTQVISKLREVISTFTPGASPSARDAPEAPPEKEPPQVRARLLQGPWGQAKIVTSSAVRASLEQSTEPMVILAATRAEHEQCERARKALGNRQNITYVVLDSNGPDSVLLEGRRGPRSAKANITYLSESAPRCAGLHAAMKGDEPVPATKLKPANFRITISAETTPALVLGDVLAERALRTRGAIAYDAEVTCIVSTTEANAADFRATSCTAPTEQPNWESLAPLGYILERPTPSNGMCRTQEFTTWATERGFQNVANAARAGARARTFFGDTPAGVVATVHAFKSGAVASRAFSKNGAPAKAARQATSGEARQRGALNKHAKGENGKPVPAGPSAPPFTKFFNVRACGAGGDCMHIAVAKGPAAIAPSRCTPAADDFEPSGRPQGNLRLAAQEEALKKTFKATTADADKIGTTGTPASPLAARLLAKRLNVDIYARPRAPGAEQWVLYGRETTEHRQALDCWREKALGYPTSGLQGKGRSHDPDAASILGIPAPSSRAASSRAPAPRLDPEAMSILGIPAPPSTAAASRAPTRRPAAATSRGARSIPGIPADNPDDEMPVAYAKGDYLKCPCGQWAPPAPPAHLSGSQASAWQCSKATAHWRECQGAAPPRLKDQPGSVSRRAIQASFWARPAFREARRAKLFAAHLKWKAALPASAQPGACSPDERTLSSKVLKRGGIQHHYTCSTCSKSTHLTQFRNYPCRAWPATMTRLSMLAAMRGEEAANRVHQAESASRKRLAKTYATSRKELYKIRYADPEQRKTKQLKDKIRFAKYRADQKHIALQKRLSQERRTAKIAKKRWAALPFYGAHLLGALLFILPLPIVKLLRTKLGVFTSGHGPAAVRSDPWMEEVVNFTSTVARGTPPVPWCIAGDLNWRPSYVDALPTHAALCAATTPTTLAGASPTRAVGAGVELKLESVAFPPLIPHDGLVIFSAQVAAPSAQATRMRRTTRFTLDPGTILLASDTEELQSHMGASLPACPAAAPLPERVATTPAARPAEPMELVRLKRLGRRVAPQLRDHADELIAGPLLRQYVDSALRGRLTAGPNSRPTHAEARGKISKAISAIQRDLLRDRRSEWRRLSQHFTTDTWRAATEEVHGPSECPSFNAEDMAEEWKRVWAPSDPNYDEQRRAARWEQHASEAREPLPKTANAYDEAKGSAGYDGWHSSELKLISEHFEFLLFELYTLRRDTCETLLRAWLTACEPSLPTPQGAQFACKPGSTVVHACCLWLHACQHGSCGLERDLSKCYDNVPHAVADAALRNAQTPRRVRAVTNAAWRGPRRCQVAGELASETLWPTRSLAQGDSTAPKVLCHALSPWEINGTKFLFMGDRSAVFDSAPQMESDVQATNAFDSGTGAIENVGKRQVWKRGDRTHIKHIGILAVPDAPDEPITPAGGWTKLRKYLRAIRGRFWASNIDLHPFFSAVLTAIDRITTWDLRWSTFLEVNFTTFFDAIGFEFLQHDPERGVQFRRSVEEPDVRVRRLCGRRRIFWSDEEMVPHLLRQVCRARALAHASASRHDSEGVDQIDLEASSARAWSTFGGSLTLEDRIHLKIFRCGATHSPTRRWSTTTPDLTAACPSRGGPHRLSARHYVAECAALAGFRQELIDAYHIPPGWWARQPRATLKTGWITFPAYAPAARRAELQVAVCRMGLVAMAEMAEDCEALKRA